jgi:hypothetical protein
MTRLSQTLETEHPRALHNMWIAADEAYPAREYLLTPVSRRNLGQAGQCFNYWQPSARIFIEQTFGIWTRRWGIFWRPIRVSMRKIPTVILCCARLHNVFIDKSKRRGTPRGYRLRLSMTLMLKVIQRSRMALLCYKMR